MSSISNKSANTNANNANNSSTFIDNNNLAESFLLKKLTSESISEFSDLNTTTSTNNTNNNSNLNYTKSLLNNPVYSKFRDAPRHNQLTHSPSFNSSFRNTSSQFGGENNNIHNNTNSVRTNAAIRTDTNNHRNICLFNVHNNSYASNLGGEELTYTITANSNQKLFNNNNNNNNNRIGVNRNNYNIYYKNNLRKRASSAINNQRNYFSACESNGEEDYEPRSSSSNNNSRYVNTDYSKQRYAACNYDSGFGSRGRCAGGESTGNRDYDREEEELKQQINTVSYASITLRQPLKDINYFSDTETVNHQHRHNNKNNNYNQQNESKFIPKESNNSRVQNTHFLPASSSFHNSLYMNNANANKFSSSQAANYNMSRSISSNSNTASAALRRNQISLLSNNENNNNIIINNTNPVDYYNRNYYNKTQRLLLNSNSNNRNHNSFSSSNNNNLSLSDYNINSNSHYINNRIINLKPIDLNHHLSNKISNSNNKTYNNKTSDRKPKQKLQLDGDEQEDDISVENITRMYNNLLASMSNFNRQPHGFSKLNPYGSSGAAQLPQQQQQQQPLTPRLFDSNNMNRVNTWAPPSNINSTAQLANFSNQQQQQQSQVFSYDEGRLDKYYIILFYIKKDIYYI